jgi:3-hydroxyacyl-CoA dehydrogenase/3-hydroxy-2-methylbutyryl-CoA dehydrogenase
MSSPVSSFTSLRPIAFFGKRKQTILKGIIMKVHGSVVIVTGGASGLGEACVRDLVKDGAKVSIFDSSQNNGERISSVMGDAVIFCKTDVSNGRAVQSAIDRTMEIFGRIDVTVNCAGVVDSSKVLGRHGPISMEHFNRILQINLVGTMNVIRLAAEKMLANIPNEDGEKGVIVNTASIAACEGQIGQVAYSASKAAIIGMTLPIAREFADYGIRVMTLSPGFFDTPMMAGAPKKALETLNRAVHFPLRQGKPSEFSQMVKQIIENPMLNGSNIRLDAALRG